MSKVTVVTDAKGQIHAIGHGHLSETSNKKRGSQEFQSGIRALPGQKLHELELPHDVTQVKTWTDLVAKVHPLLQTRA
jgi:hypothetical protein